jgi:hypothetical protein
MQEADLLSFFSLIIFSQLSFWNLPGTGPPIHAMTGNHGKNLWIIRTAKDSSQELWHTSGLYVQKIDIPGTTDYFIPHPVKNVFFTVRHGEVLIWKPVAGQFQPTSLGQLTLKKNRIPIWRIGYWINHTLFLPGNSGMTLFFTQKHSKTPVLFPYKLSPPDKPDMTTMEALPAVIQSHNSVWWLGGSTLFQYQNQRIQTTPLYRSSSMGRVIPLLQQNETDWFIFDGKQGHLKSFGWRIIPGEQSQSGILTRSAQDPGRGRICFTTISNQVSSHLFASVTGKKSFTSWVCEKEDASWKRVYKKEFSLKDTQGLFGINWPGDVNGDNLLDMTVSDKKNGFRVFLSVKGSGFSPEPATLSRSVPENLLELDHGFAWIVSTNSSWNLFWLRSMQ